MSADPLQTVWDALDEHDCRPHGDPWKGTARCPAHDDSWPSLSIAIGADGRALLYCHRGCETEAVVRALGLQWCDLFPPGHHHARRASWLAKPRRPADVILDAVREQGLDYRSTRHGDLWVIETCPACRAGELWLHEDDEDRGPPRVRLACMNGCEQHDVLAALAQVTT